MGSETAVVSKEIFQKKSIIGELRKSQISLNFPIFRKFLRFLTINLNYGQNQKIDK